MDVWMYVLLDGWMDGRMDGWMDGWMHGCMDAWMDGRMDGWMDGLCMYVCVCLRLRYTVRFLAVVFVLYLFL